MSPGPFSSRSKAGSSGWQSSGAPMHDLVWSASDPAAIDDVVLRGAGGRVVGSEEDGERRDLVRHELALQALSLHQLDLALWRHPFIELALGHDPSRRDCVHADVVGAVIARQRACETDHA